MNGKFNIPQLMGNCENCYYATDESLEEPWREKGKSFECHRYPGTIIKDCGDYCGEFASKVVNQ